VTLDLCPTSNVQAGIVPSLEAHPLARLHRLGVPVTLSTDDLTVSDISLSDEYERAVSRVGLTVVELWAIDRLALDVAFATPDDLAAVRASYDVFEASLSSD
jgi:adenosine deaminase